MGQGTAPVVLNLGCGFSKMSGAGVVNVDGFANCTPDVLHDLNAFPYPWADCSVDHIFAFHIFEHLKDWWAAFSECARILKPGGILEMRVPDESSTSAGTYRDHLHIISSYSFCGVVDGFVARHNTNAWAATVDSTVPFKQIGYVVVPFPQYNWMRWVPGLLNFCHKHLRNFFWEQRFTFRKIGGGNG
jgi:SAM-dependent methyltransferase